MRALTIYEKSRPFYTADGFLHIRVILKRDAKRARRDMEFAPRRKESVVLPASEAEQRDQGGGGDRQQHPQCGLGFIAGLG